MTAVRRVVRASLPPRWPAQTSAGRLLSTLKVGCRSSAASCVRQFATDLPAVISDTVLYHHRPWDAPSEQVFIACTTLGDHLCHISNIGVSGPAAVLGQQQRNGFNLNACPVQ